MDGIIRGEDCSLDLFWLSGRGAQENSQNLDEIVGSIVLDLQFALSEVEKLMPSEDEVA
jgi:hypothetical protein